jgi:biopolymer transport protein ExbD
MHGQTSSLRGRRLGAEPTAELDVTPVMNMFIILIPFLISMTAFTHLAVHDFSLPANEGPGHTTERGDLPLTVAVGLAGLLVAEGDVVLSELPREGASLDLEGLSRLLGARQPSRLVLAVDQPIVTGEVVAILDACRAAGWNDVGLASGTGLVLDREVDQ